MGSQSLGDPLVDLHLLRRRVSLDRVDFLLLRRRGSLGIKPLSLRHCVRLGAQLHFGLGSQQKRKQLVAQGFELLHDLAAQAGGYHAVAVTKAIATHRMTLEDAQRAFELVAATMHATPSPAANECTPPVHLYPSTGETSLRNTPLTAALD